MCAWQAECSSSASLSITTTSVCLQALSLLSEAYVAADAGRVTLLWISAPHLIRWIIRSWSSDSDAHTVSPHKRWTGYFHIYPGARSLFAQWRDVFCDASVQWCPLGISSWPCSFHSVCRWCPQACWRCWTLLLTICKYTATLIHHSLLNWWLTWATALLLYRHFWPTIGWNSTQQRLMSCGLGQLRRLQQCTSDPLQLHGASIQPSECVRDLGVVVDSGLTLADQVSHITNVCFFYVRQLRLIRHSLTVDTDHSLVWALIHSHLDYCNGWLGWNQFFMQRHGLCFSYLVKCLFLLPCMTCYTGLASRNESLTNCASWHTNVSMVLHLVTCLCLSQQLRDVLSCVHLTIINCSSHGHEQSLLYLVLSTHQDLHHGTLPAMLCDPAVTLGRFRQR